MAILSSVSSFSYNKVTVGQTGILHFNVFNTYSFPVTVNLVSSNVVFSLSDITAIIPANGQKQITVIFTPNAVNTFSGNITITNLNDANVITIPLLGLGVKPTMTVTGTLNFGKIAVEDNKILSLTVKNTSSDANLIVTNITSSLIDYTIVGGSTSFTLYPNQQKDVQIKASSLTSHVSSGTITINNNTSAALVTIPAQTEFIIPTVSIIPNSLNFGSVAVGATKTESFIITNTSVDDIRLKVNSIISSNIKYTLSTSSALLEKDKNITVVITYTPTDSSIQNGTITVDSNAPNQLISVTGSGLVVPLIEPPTSIDFGTVLTKTINTKNITIYNRGVIELHVTASLISSVFSISISSFSVAPNGSYVLPIQYNPLIPNQDVASLLLTHDDPTKDTPIEIPVLGLAEAPIISIEPLSLDFENIAIEDEKILNIKISNDSDKHDLIISSIVSSNTDYTATINSLMINKKSSRELQIKAKSSLVHSSVGTITINNNSSNNSTCIIPVQAIFETPAITLDTTNLDFGNVSEGESKTKNIKITNTSINNIRVVLNSVVSSNSRFSIVAGPVVKLNKNQSILIPVSFSAIDLSTQTGIITIDSNAPDVLLPENAVGFASAVLDAPTKVDFGVVALGTEEIKDVKIGNDGSLTLNVTAELAGNVFSIINSSVNINIAPKSFYVLKVKYTPFASDSAELKLTTNDPDNIHATVLLTGISASPIIGVKTPLDFSKVLINQTSVKNLTITNSGVVPLNITAFNFGLPIYYTTESLPVIIESKTSKNISITVLPVASGSADSTLTIISNDYNHPNDTVVELKTICVSPDVLLNPTSVDFGTIAVNVIKTMQVMVTNRGTGNLIVTDVISDNLVFTTELKTFTVIPNGNVTLNIQVLIATETTQTGSIVLTTNDPDTTARITLKVIGTKPSIQVSVNPINMGKAAFNETISKALSITNDGSIDATVNFSTLTPFSVLPTSLIIQPNKSSEVWISFKNSIAGIYSGTLSISYNPTLPPIVLNAEAANIPRANINPTSLDFGTVTIGTPKSRVVVLKNIGTQELTFSSQFVNNTSSYSMNPSTGNVAAGGQVSLLVTFNPTSGLSQEMGLSPTNDFPSTLNITTNDPITAISIVTITGKSEMGKLMWKTIKLELPKEIAEVAESLSNVLSSIVVVLDIINGLLTVLKAFIVDLLDPLKAIINGLITLMENLKKSLAAAGLYILPIIPDDTKVNPQASPDTFVGFTLEELDKIFPSPLVNALDYLNGIKGGSKAFINKITASFDDVADSNRPQFDSGSIAGALVFAIDSGNIVNIIDIIAKLCRLFGIEYRNQFTPPTNVQTISGNKLSRVTFTAGEGLLPNAFMIWRSETSGGELVSQTITVDKKSVIQYAMDEKGRLIKNYKLIAVKTLKELIAQAFKQTPTEAASLISKAGGYINGLISSMDQVSAMKFYYDDTNDVVNDKTYYYTVSSALVDEDAATTMKDKIGEYKNTITYTFDGKTFLPTSDISGAAGLKGNGGMSTECSCSPKSAFEANLTGQGRCRNFICSFYKEATDNFNIENPGETGLNIAIDAIKKAGIQLKNKPVQGGSIAINIKRTVSGSNIVFEYPRNKYTVNLTAGIVSFIDVTLMQKKDVLSVSYQYTASQKMVEQEGSTAARLQDSSVRTIFLKAPVTEIISVIGKEATGLNGQNYNRETITSYELDQAKGILFILNTKILYPMDVSVRYKYNVAITIKDTPESLIFKCKDPEKNTFLFDTVKCDNGTNLCPSYENRTCIWNTATICSNSGISVRPTLKVLSPAEQAATGAYSGLYPENIPFYEFYDPILCQNGYMAGRCDGYAKVLPRAGVKGSPPNWKRTPSLEILLSPLFRLIDLMIEFLKSLLDGISKMGAAIIAFINLIQKKIEQLKAFILRIKSIIDMLRRIFDVGSVSFLNIPPSQGGNEYLKSSIKTATKGPNSDSSGYTAGIMIAYGGPDAVSIAKAFKVLF